jgi:hypothetical protein
MYIYIYRLKKVQPIQKETEPAEMTEAEAAMLVRILSSPKNNKKEYRQPRSATKRRRL